MVSQISNLSPATVAGNFRRQNHEVERRLRLQLTTQAQHFPVHGNSGNSSFGWSGTTAAFTAYITAVAPPYGQPEAAKNVEFPGGQAAKGSDGVSTAVKQTAGAIGYAEVSYAKAAGLPMAKRQECFEQVCEP